MARPLRIEFAGALYHLTSRGNERRNIFRSDRDRRAFLDLLGIAAKRFGWSVTAWVLISNHFHLVVQILKPNLSRGMHWLNGAYAGWFNRIYGRSGHLFQGRFKAFLIDRESYQAEVLRYVVLNPVRATMVDRPEQYKWSSYRATAGLEKAPEWFDLDAALSLFGSERGAASRGLPRVWEGLRAPVLRSNPAILSVLLKSRPAEDDIEWHVCAAMNKRNQRSRARWPP